MSGKKRQLTADQIVASNLRTARKGKGLTQAEVGRRLGEHLGREWTRQALSEVELSADRPAGERPREFTASELLAFSRVFDKPLLWFLIPPEGTTHVASSKGKRAIGVGDYVDRLVGDPNTVQELVARIREVTRDLPDELRSDLQSALERVLWAPAAGVLARSLGDVTSWADQLDATANQQRDMAQALREASERWMADLKDQEAADSVDIERTGTAEPIEAPEEVEERR